MTRSQTILTPALATVLSLSLSGECSATSFGSPTDYESESPNGQYRFVADYPDIADASKKFIAIISYTLIETKTDTVRWSIDGKYYPEIDGVPGKSYGAYVGNSGGVLLYGPMHRSFTALAASDGKVGLHMGYRFEAPYTLQPAGHWINTHSQLMRYSFRSVVEIEGQSYLLTRACWGERQLLGFMEQGLITKLTAEQLLACDATERHWVRDTLAKAPERLDKDVQDVISLCLQDRDQRNGDPRHPMNVFMGDLQTAMQMASRFDHRGVIPELRAMEQWRPVIPEGHGLADYDLRSLQSSGRTLLRTARLALRRLGEKPANYQPPFYLVPGWRTGTGRESRLRDDRVELPDVIAYTDADIDSISKGMPVRKVIELLGAPDAMRYAEKSHRILEFDIDTDNPFTLRISYKANVSTSDEDLSTVEITERITPPRWTIEARRDLELDWDN